MMRLDAFFLAIILVLVCCSFSYSEDIEITVPLKFGDDDLQLSFPANKNAALVMAEKFCKEKAMAEGKQMDSCLETIGEYLASAVDRHNKKEKKGKVETEEIPQEETLTISLQIGSIVYDVKYKYEVESSFDVASLFCSQNMKALGITESALNSCVDPVMAQLDATLAKHYKSIGKSPPKKAPIPRERKIEMDIGGVIYELTIDTSKETIEETAAKFCLSKLDTFDLTEDNMKELCADLIVDYVKSQL